MDNKQRAERLHEMDRAERARALLQNPLLTGAFDAVEAELMRRWKQDATLGAEGRERCFLMVTLLEQVKHVLGQHMQTGQMAELQLKQHNEEQRQKTRLENLASGLRFWQ